MKKDKVYYGMISGVIAGIGQNSLNLLSFSLGIASLRYIDWVSIMTYGHPPVTILDGAFALVIQLGLNGFIGIIAVYLLPIIGYEHHFLKSSLIGSGVFGFSYFITSLYQVPGLIIIPTYTAISNSVTSAIFGIILVIIIKKWVYNA